MSFPVRRIADISKVLLRFGFKELGVLFGQRVDELRGAEAMAHGQVQAITATAKNRGKRIRRALEELGPTYVKFGQVLSTRPDLIGAEFTSEFGKLQDEVPSFEYEEVAKIIETEFGQKPEELFKSFGKKPIASASLAQVHKAILPDGKIVAVKIQRPGIQKTIRQDIELLMKAANILEKRSPYQKVTNARDIIKTFKEAIAQEVDFEREKKTIDKFESLYGDHPVFVVPHAYPDFSSPLVVTMDFIDGTKITDVSNLAKAKLDRKLVAKHGMQVILTQIFENGFFHGDPHPGNVMVLDEERIAYVDYGLTGTLDSEQKKGMLKLLLSLTDQNPDLAIEALTDLKIVEDDSTLDKLGQDIKALYKRFGNLPIGQYNFSELSGEIIEIMRTHDLKLPRDLMLLVKAISTSETVGQKLDPSFSIVANIRPYLEAVLAEELRPKALFKRIRDFSSKNAEVIEQAPAALSNTLDKLQKGKLSVQIEHKGLEKLEKSIDIGSNQISYGVIIAALVLGGALLARLDVGIFIGDLNLFSLIFFGLAGVMGFILVSSIWRERYRR